MAFRKDLIALVGDQPRSVSSLARELGLKRGDVEDDLRHAIRSARAAGHAVEVLPARCRACGFTFDEAGEVPGLPRHAPLRAADLHQAAVARRESDETGAPPLTCLTLDG